MFASTNTENDALLDGREQMNEKTSNKLNEPNSLMFASSSIEIDLTLPTTKHHFGFEFYDFSLALNHPPMR